MQTSVRIFNWIGVAANNRGFVSPHTSGFVHQDFRRGGAPRHLLAGGADDNVSFARWNVLASVEAIGLIPAVDDRPHGARGLVRLPQSDPQGRTVAPRPARAHRFGAAYWGI